MFHSLETGDKCPLPPTHPNFPIFLFGAGRGEGIVLSRRPDYRRFKIPSFTSPGHTHCLVCAPRATFSFTPNIILCVKNVFFMALMVSSGGGGHVPPRPPLVPALNCKFMSLNDFNIYCRELAPEIVSLTGDRAQGDDSKQCAYSSLQNVCSF